MFISSYPTIYYFVKNFFFECLYFSEYDIRMFLFVFWSSKMCTGALRGRGVSRPMCTYAVTLSLFMFLLYGVLFYLQKFNLTFIQKECVCQKWLFFSNEINFCCNEISFFTLNWFSESKLAKARSILIKQSLMYTVDFSVTPYFEKIQCSVARRLV